VEGVVVGALEAEGQDLGRDARALRGVGFVFFVVVVVKGVVK